MTMTNAERALCRYWREIIFFKRDHGQSLALVPLAELEALIDAILHYSGDRLEADI
jgi:hypothetical protein